MTYKQTVPIYIVRTKQDDEIHLCAGIKPKTLCGSKKIMYAELISFDSNPLLEFKDANGECCQDCIKTWNKVKEHLEQEMTVECHCCGKTYSEFRAKKVKYKIENKPVCTSCYNKLYHSSKNDINTPLHKAESFSERTPDSRYVKTKNN